MVIKPVSGRLQTQLVPKHTPHVPSEEYSVSNGQPSSAVVESVVGHGGVRCVGNALTDWARTAMDLLVYNAMCV